ncbi:MAG: glycine cleavage system protein GcvH [Planctomycetes bacterium]|nr:glycine cleavage system protein GcvH [Planctomycetota bacterium]
MEIPGDLRFAETHEWARVDGGVATIGLTAYATDKLGDLTYLKLPAVGAKVSKGESFGEIESVKTVSDLYAPLSGEVIEINGAAAQNPETISGSPYGEGWLIRIRIDRPDEADGLLDPAAYAAIVEE